MDLSAWEDEESTVKSSPIKTIVPKKRASKKVRSKVVTAKDIKNDPDIPNDFDYSGIMDVTGETVDFEEVARRTKIAEMIEKEEKAKQAQLTTAVKRGELLKREMFYDHMVPFIDRMLGDIDRIGSSYLSDIANEIVENGGIKPSIRAMWTDKIMEIKDNAKKQAMKNLKAIEKGQAEK